MYEFAVTPAVTQLRRPGVIITEVTPDSLGAELELEPNDRIIRAWPHVRIISFRLAAGKLRSINVRNQTAKVEIAFDRDESEDFAYFEHSAPTVCQRAFCFCK